MSSFWSVNPPVAGDMYLACFRFPTTTGLAANSPSASWTRLVNGTSPDAADDIEYITWKILDSADISADTITFTFGASTKYAAVHFHITGTDTTNHESSSATTGTGANLDPASFTPAAGSKDWLYVSFIGLDGETQTFTEPSGYSGRVDADSGTGGAVATNCRISIASKGTSGSSSENPGAWTHAAPNAGVTAYTIAIAPPAGATGSLLWPAPTPSTVFLR